MPTQPTPEDLAALTPLNPFGRFPDGRPRVPDEILDQLVPCGSFDELPDLLLERFAGLGQGITVGVPADLADDDAFARVLAAIREG